MSTARPWAMLAAGVVAQLASAVTVHGPAFLIPMLHRQGLSLAEAGLVAAAPVLGVTLALVAWGYAADRCGERFALLVGLGGTAAAGLVVCLVHSLVALVAALLVAGAFAASASAASGRVVVGWFPAERRGLAMGIRQMAQPLGVGVGALSLPVLADAAGMSTALAVPFSLAVLATLLCALVVVDPPRAPAPAGGAPNPYAGARYLHCIHLVSVLLVVPQFVVWTYALAWLVEARGWSSAGAGLLVAASQVAGALGRIVVGHVSDRVSSRLRPLTWVAVAAAVTMAALSISAAGGSVLAVMLLVVATAVTVADNGLAFTAVAEYAGSHWTGRALGVQNTSQFLAAGVCAPVAGAIIGAFGYPAAFAVAAAFPVAALAIIPRRTRGAGS